MSGCRTPTELTEDIIIQTSPIRNRSTATGVGCRLARHLAHFGGEVPAALCLALVVEGATESAAGKSNARNWRLQRRCGAHWPDGDIQVGWEMLPMLPMLVIGNWQHWQWQHFHIQTSEALAKVVGNIQQPNRGNAGYRSNRFSLRSNETTLSWRCLLYATRRQSTKSSFVVPNVAKAESIASG